MHSSTLKFEGLLGAYRHGGDCSSRVARSLAGEVCSLCVQRAVVRATVRRWLNHYHVCVSRGEEGDGRSRENGFEGRHDVVLCDLVSCLTKWNCGFCVWFLFDVV